MRSDTAGEKLLFAGCGGQAGSDKLSGGTRKVCLQVVLSAFHDCFCFLLSSRDPVLTLLCDRSASPWKLQLLRVSFCASLAASWSHASGAAEDRMDEQDMEVQPQGVAGLLWASLMERSSVAFLLLFVPRALRHCG